MLPTRFLAEPVVWEALLEEMPATALLRNLAAMTRVGLLAPGSRAAYAVADRLADAAALRKARVHPVQVLSALRTYASGRGVRGKGTWTPVAAVVDALDAAFYGAFAHVEPTGKRVLLALDVSGSMTVPVHGLEGLSCREASAAMALVTAATEPRHRFAAFTAETPPAPGEWMGHGLSELAVSPRQRLDDVVRAVDGLPFGATDCALPMVEAEKRGWMVDVFVVYTDNETWAGEIHPAQALRRYRERTGIPAKLVVVGMASNGFTIADPEDAGMLDVVGFDAAAPQLIADFAR
jgi:60 kDa SS-A/Ro ribonucleoprotein